VGKKTNLLCHNCKNNVIWACERPRYMYVPAFYCLHENSLDRTQAQK
jgi:hypothetical protein